MTAPVGKAPELKKPQKKESFCTSEERKNFKTNYGTEIVVENGSVEDVSTKQMII